MACRARISTGYSSLRRTITAFQCRREMEMKDTRHGPHQGSAVWLRRIRGEKPHSWVLLVGFKRKRRLGTEGKEVAL